MPQQLSKINLVNDPRVRAILQHLARYRLGLFPTFRLLPEMSGCPPRELRDLLCQCEQQRLVATARLHHRAKYWHLESLGAQYCQLPERRSGPLSEPAKIRALAMLRFCCLSNRPRHLLTADQLAAGLPALAHVGLPHGYYFDPAGAGRLGLARVDAARRGRWDRILESLRNDIDDHAARPGFGPLVRAGRFEITVLTVFPQKAKRIQDSLPHTRGTDRVPVQVVVIPELLPLVESDRQPCRKGDHHRLTFFDRRPADRQRS